MVARTAHVVGGGIGGMSVAACLARRGWDVTVHERSLQAREIGAGIGIKENSLRVMEELGCIDAIMACSHRIEHTFINDRPGRYLRRTSYGPERVFTILREDLHRELSNSAIAWGARIEFGSQVKTVSPDGMIVTEAGRQRADLIVGADGLGSIVRSQTGLGTSRYLGSGSTRVLIPWTAGDPTDTSGEYWRGHKRVLVMPMASRTLYICASSREDDRRSVSLPFDADHWSAAFPELSDMFRRIPADGGTHYAHGQVKASGWCRGRVALLGDAVHGQPPNLGQGAGMAISNGQALARALDADLDVEAALKAWERQCIKFTHHVQNWSLGWEHMMHGWPLPLSPLRSLAVTALATFPPTARHWKSLYRGLPAGDQATGATGSVAPEPSR